MGPDAWFSSLADQHSGVSLDVLQEPLGMLENPEARGQDPGLPPNITKTTPSLFYLMGFQVRFLIE